MILRARAVLPITGPPIFDGTVLVSGNRIKGLGRWRDLGSRISRKFVDLGETVLMPGLVNAHCHLDYTHMAGQFPPPKFFTDWLKVITSTKAQWNISEYKASWLTGAGMLLKTGTTAVADIEAVPQLLPAVWEETPLRIVSFLELIGITGRRPPEVVLHEAVEKIAALKHVRCAAGLSPHAPYSTVPELLASTAEAARRNRWPVCTHVAESRTEFAMISDARGEMFEWLKRSGRDMSDCGAGSPIAHLERHGLLRSNLVAVHANYLARGDAAILSRRKVSVAHCPRSHEYFRHEPFPIERLLRAGVNVCIGTDSLASVLTKRGQPVELDMFAEMRLLSQNHPALSPKQIVRMATINGARALGLAAGLGELSDGARADLIALPWTGKKERLIDDVLQQRGPVNACLIDGKWAIPPP
jgi:cytosine/adenosine deaminase-related metal-dependent hydrolase